MKRKKAYRKVDHCDFEGARCWGEEGRHVSEARDWRGDLLQLESQVRRVRGL
jgi:hypothetical protein